jgi:hypothetical protein
MDMASTNYRVQQGDCMSSIAAAYGFQDWKAIYNHPDNADLKEKRKDPNILFPGDRVVIPDIQTKDVDEPVEVRHTFVLKREKVMLRIVLKDGNGKPYASKNYKLTVDGNETKGSTDGDGLLEEKIPAGAEGGELILFTDGGEDDTGVLFTLDLGHLDPVEEDSGVIARLHNLGYDFDEDDPDELKNALVSFQNKNSLDESGEIDDATRNKLKDMHEGDA